MQYAREGYDKTIFEAESWVVLVLLTWPCDYITAKTYEYQFKSHQVIEGYLLGDIFRHGV